jgi:hypothetical protein
MKDWIKSIIERNFDKLFLLSLFVICAALMIRFPNMSERTAQFIMSGPIIGAILMLITGNKKIPPTPDGPTAGKVITDTHTEEETK